MRRAAASMRAQLRHAAPIGQSGAAHSSHRVPIAHATESAAALRSTWRADGLRVSFLLSGIRSVLSGLAEPSTLQASGAQSFHSRLLYPREPVNVRPRPGPASAPLRAPEGFRGGEGALRVRGAPWRVLRRATYHRPPEANAGALPPPPGHPEACGPLPFVDGAGAPSASSSSPAATNASRYVRT